MDQHIDHARVGHFYVDHAREQASARRQVHRADAQLQVAVDYFGDVVDHPRRVAGHHADRNPERALRFVAPASFEYPVGVVLAETLCVGTVRAVDRNAGTHGDEAEDFVAANRIAAFCQFVVELSDLFVDDECVYEGENETYIEASVENSSSILYDKEIRNKPRTRRTKRNV